MALLLSTLPLLPSFVFTVVSFPTNGFGSDCNAGGVSVATSRTSAPLSPDRPLKVRTRALPGNYVGLKCEADLKSPS